MSAKVENIGGLRFVGDYVLIPAFDIWCVVIEPQGVVIGGHWEEDRALGIAQALECHLFEDDMLGTISCVRVYKGTELKKARPKEVRKIEDHAQTTRHW